MACLDNNQSVYRPIDTQCLNNNPHAIEKTHILNHTKFNTIKICHQNIRGFFHKFDELLISLLLNPPEILCLSEHHLKIDEIINTNLDIYTLGSQYSRQTFKQGGVCIYVLNNIQFRPINTLRTGDANLRFYITTAQDG